jgi:hypothetical protein
MPFPQHEIEASRRVTTEMKDGRHIDSLAESASRPASLQLMPNADGLDRGFLAFKPIRQLLILSSATTYPSSGLALSDLFTRLSAVW